MTIMIKKSCFSVIAFIGIALAGASCSRDSARLAGQFLGSEGKNIYLERVAPGYTSVVDSVKADERGDFGFKITLKDRQPTIFNLRYEGDLVPLIISPREKVRVTSFGDLTHSYNVTGSPQSEKISDLHAILTGGLERLDSISYLLTATNPGDDERRELSRAYYKEYYRIKREHIRFIVENSSNLAGVYALYQRLPGDDVLFNGENDFVYYQMVADSVERYYPNSRYVVALQNEIEARNAKLDLQNKLNAVTEYSDYPDIDLPDMYGHKVKLSSMGGKVILLDFWATSVSDSRINNAEMKELYAEYADRGLAIYQVSVDTSKSVWVTAVQEQKIPWTTVCDFKGASSTAVRTYNVQNIPTNFIIDREGNIVAKNLYGDALAKKIRELI
jgi:peroxiredoxin